MERCPFEPNLLFDILLVNYIFTTMLFEPDDIDVTDIFFVLYFNPHSLVDKS